MNSEALGSIRNRLNSFPSVRLAAQRDFAAHGTTLASGRALGGAALDKSLVVLNIAEAYVP